MKDPWQECLAFAEAVRLRVHADPAFRGELEEACATWELDPGPTQAKATLLAAVALRSLLMDRQAGGVGIAEPLNAVSVEQVARAALERPAHELFAGLPAVLPEADRADVGALKLLSYATSGAAVLAWRRLRHLACVSIRHTQGDSASDLWCAEIVRG